MTLPGEIPQSIATQFLHRYKRSDPRCNTDEFYCETHLDSCMVSVIIPLLYHLIILTIANNIEHKMSCCCK